MIGRAGLVQSNACILRISNVSVSQSASGTSWTVVSGYTFDARCKAILLELTVNVSTPFMGGQGKVAGIHDTSSGTHEIVNFNRSVTQGNVMVDGIGGLRVSIISGKPTFEIRAYGSRDRVTQAGNLTFTGIIIELAPSNGQINYLVNSSSYIS